MAMRVSCIAFASVVLLVQRQSQATRTKATMSANPIRRVVTMLQMMQKKVEGEGEKSKELFEKFSCYCKNGETELGNSIQEAQEKIPELEADIEESSGLKKQLDSELVGHKKDREEATTAIAEANTLREKDAKAFEAESAEQKSNIAALGKAIPAIEKGMGAEFLQTATAGQLRGLLPKVSKDALNEYDRGLLESFLEQGQGDSDSQPSSGELVGIMKQMGDEMEKDLADMVEGEKTAVGEHETLIDAKEKEIAAATKAIEEKTKRVGEIAVQLVEMKQDLEDSSASLKEDTKFLAELEKTCAMKKKEFEAESKVRSQELLALSDTIKLLNDDDAQDLFKKTLPSASAFIDVGESDADVRNDALDALRGSLQESKSNPSDYRVSYLALALKGRKVGFEKVVQMVDDMVTLLGKEQKDDDDKKRYCTAELEKTQDNLKGLEGTVADLGKAVDEAKDTIEGLTEDIQSLSDGLVQLDRDVAAATEQRKEENTDYTANLAANNAAIQLIEMAKNRLGKFYNAKAALVQKGNDVDGDSDGLVFVQVHVRAREVPTSFLYDGKEEAGGVMQMMDTLKEDLKTEVQEMDSTEKEAQGDYEKMVNDAAGKRNSDLRSITQKDAAKAELMSELDHLLKEKKGRDAERADVVKYLAEVHQECDWLLQNYDTRKTARANEVEALNKAKAILSGADYSLLQTGMRIRHHLRNGRV